MFVTPIRFSVVVSFLSSAQKKKRQREASPRGTQEIQPSERTNVKQVRRFRETGAAVGRQASRRKVATKQTPEHLQDITRSLRGIMGDRHKTSEPRSSCTLQQPGLQPSSSRR